MAPATFGYAKAAITGGLGFLPAEAGQGDFALTIRCLALFVKPFGDEMATFLYLLYLVCSGLHRNEGKITMDSNLCVLIQSIYELGLEPVFWTFEAKEPVASKQLEMVGL